MTLEEEFIAKCLPLYDSCHYTWGRDGFTKLPAYKHTAEISHTIKYLDLTADQQHIENPPLCYKKSTVVLKYDRATGRLFTDECEYVSITQMVLYHYMKVKPEWAHMGSWLECYVLNPRYKCNKRPLHSNLAYEGFIKDHPFITHSIISQLDSRRLS